jgi:peptide/nickel transport system ATP-binding protein
MPVSDLPATEKPILELDHLVVGFQTGERTAFRAVRDVSLSVRRGETLGIVGESGSGKSVSLMGAFGLLPGNAVRLGGTARFEGRDVAALPASERRALLGKDVAFVFQNPISSLDPVLSIGDQLIEALTIHDRRLSKAAARKRAAELLNHVGITEPERRLGQYPHEFSGGMCQRVMIAMALANRPQLLIADEPTTAVDATIQAQILKLMRELRAEVSGAVILVSHDLGVIAENTESLAVMYAGKVVESGPTAKVLADPRHPYTQGLLSCRPSIDGVTRLEPIPGQPPSIAVEAPGCPFCPRCPVGRDKEICATTMPERAPSGASLAACHFAGTPAFGAAHRARHDDASGAAAGKKLFTLANIGVEFPVRGGQFWGKRRTTRAVDGVDIDLFAGEALGMVGESGSGKSTLARVMMRLVDATAGTVSFDGVDITSLGRRDLVDFRSRVQMVFQDPLNSLNPRLSAGENAAEPLRLRGVPADERRRRVIERFGEVGLEAGHYDRGVTEMSGGQLQRVGIARALAVDPDVLIMDEPVSALDVSVQAQILNLLIELKARRNLSYVFISHDMAVVRYLCDRVAVMNLGRIVEIGAADAIFERPSQDYTRKLLSAVPNVRAVQAVEPA